MSAFDLRKRFNRSTIMARLVARAVSLFAGTLFLAASSRLRHRYELGAITDEYSR